MDLTYTPDQDAFRGEVRSWLAANAPALAPERILRMATINAAKALGLEKRIGEISNGALAETRYHRVSAPTRSNV